MADTRVSTLNEPESGEVNHAIGCLIDNQPHMDFPLIKRTSGADEGSPQKDSGLIVGDLVGEQMPLWRSHPAFCVKHKV